LKLSVSASVGFCALAFLGACSSSVGAGGSDGGNHQPSSRGFALAIGLNAVDPAHYGGWSGVLGGCEPDAIVMKNIASSAGLQVQTLLTQAAKREAVLAAIADAAGKLEPGDLYVLSYSGHGGQVPDVNGDEVDDGLDETWCLFDGQLVDDEIYGALTAFKAGVRVLVFSDSCHSGTAIRVMPADFNQITTERASELDTDWKQKSRLMNVRGRDRAPMDASRVAVRAMPPDVKLKTHRQNKAMYDRIGAKYPKTVRADVQCSAILISGCEDAQYSADLGSNGLFTAELQQVWANDSFSGSHPSFHVAIRDAVLQSNASQRPAYFTVGANNSVFESQRPYTLVVP
jgi:hypothetical protein